MPFTEFYMQTTGNDLNAGSTNADAALYTSTAGNWDGTSAFTPTDGSTPSSTVSVGMWVDVYNTGDTAARYIAQVTAVGAGVNGTITVSTTAKYGSAPTSNSGSRNIKVGGAWASSAALTGIAASTAPASTRINIKAGTYGSLSTQTWKIGGAAGILVWYRGYKSSPGDLDAVSLAGVTAWNPGTDCPSMTFSSSNLVVSGKDSIFSGIAATSSSTVSPTVTFSGSNIQIHRSVLTATGANAASNAVKMSASAIDLDLCCLKATLSAAVVLTVGASADVRGNYIQGGLNAISNTTAGPVNVVGNVCDSPGSDAISIAVNSACVIHENTIYNAGGHGISLISTMTSDAAITSNLFHTITTAGKYCVAFVGSTDVGCVRLTNNAVYNCNAGTDANGVSSGLGDMPAWDTIAEAVNPLPYAASHNFVYAGATGQGAGLPGVFQDTGDGVAMLAGRDPGASQHVAAVFATRRNLCVPIGRYRLRSPTLFIAGASTTNTVLIAAPPRRRPYPVYVPVRRPTAFRAHAGILVARTPPRQIVRTQMVRRSAGNALFSSAVVTQTVLVTSPRKVR
jgi:hypothetical protein